MNANKGNLWKAMAVEVVKLGTLDGGSFAEGGGRDNMEEHDNDCVRSVDGVFQGAALDPGVGVKATTLTKGATAVTHWRIRPKVDTLNVEMSASGGNTTFLAGGVTVALKIVLFFNC